MRIHVCYLDCHEAGLCCYLVIYTENLLHILQLLLPFVTYLLTLLRTIYILQFILFIDLLCLSPNKLTFLILLDYGNVLFQCKASHH
jgi:hypothetical protein